MVSDGLNNSSFSHKKRIPVFVDEKAIKMLEAKSNLDQKKLQLQQLDARIKKLQVEEQKAMRRVNEAKRQQ